ncbi:MAG: TonB family protein [Bdellovibrionota bacterium]
MSAVAARGLDDLSSSWHPAKELRDDRLRKWVGFSVAAHAVLFGIILAGPLVGGHAKPHSLGPLIEVALVPSQTVPAPVPASLPSPAAAPTAKAVERASAKPVAPPSPKGVVLEKAGKKEKEIPQGSRVEQKENAEEAARQKEREKLLASLSALKKEAPVASAPKNGTARSVDEISESLSRAAKEKQEREALASAEKLSGGVAAAYEAKVVREVEKKWRVPANLSRLKDLTAIVRFEISSAGKVQKVALDKSSGNAAFDESVLRAAGQVLNLEAPPPGVSQTLLVRFNNREMGK